MPRKDWSDGEGDVCAPAIEALAINATITAEAEVRLAMLPRLSGRP
jgi:hypothetical protein